MNALMIGLPAIRGFLSVLIICVFVALLSGCMSAGIPGVPSPGIIDNSSQIPGPVGITTLEHREYPVKRIISQNDDATELLLAIGASDSIVGITNTATKKPYLTEKIPHARSIGDWLFPDMETVLSLNPDVIVSYSTSRPRNLEKLTAANLSLVYCDAYRINTLVPDARLLGELTGHSTGAERYVAFYEKYSSLVESRVPRTPKGDQIRVYAEAYSDYSVMTERSAGGRILDALNVQNIYGNHTSDWATVSPEWVIGEDPDIIIKFSTDPQKGENLTSVRERIMRKPGYSNISAVKNNRVYDLH